MVIELSDTEIDLIQSMLNKVPVTGLETMKLMLLLGVKLVQKEEPDA